MFHIERRKSWRMLQSRAGINNEDYTAQKFLLDKLQKGEISRNDLIQKGSELMQDTSLQSNENF